MPRFVVVGCLLGLALILGACSAMGGPVAPPIASAPAVPVAAGSDAGDTTGSTALVITFGADERDRLAYEPLIERFNRDNPDLFVQFVPLDATARLGSSQPAIVERSMRAIAQGADAFALQFARAEHTSSPLLRDLQPLIDADPRFDRADFYPLALPATTTALRFVPLRVEVPLLAYNRDAWAAQHLSAPQPAWSWRELLAAAEQLSGDRTGDDTVGLLNQHDANSAVVALLGELEAANIAPGEDVRLDQPAAGAALERIVTLVQNGTLARPLAPQQLQAEDVQPRLRGGNAILWPAGRWPAFMGELPYATGTAAYPPGPLPQPLSVNGVALSAGTQHPTEAWRWLSWLSRQNVEAPAGTVLNDYTLPARRSVAEAAGVWSRFDAEQTAALHVMLQRPVPGDSRSAEALATALTDALLAVLDGSEAAEAALQTAQRAQELELADLARPAPSSAPVLVATPAPTPAVPVTRIRFESGSIPIFQLPAVVQQFNREHETIEVVVSNPSPNASSELSALARRADCFSSWAFGVQENTDSVRDLRPLLDADAAFPRDDFLPGSTERLERDGKQVGLPLGVRFTVIGYNKTLFDTAGQEYPRADWTWDDFRRAAEGLTAETDGNRVFGFGDPAGGLLAAEFAVRQQNAVLFSRTGDGFVPNFADPSVVAALQTYLDLVQTTSPHQRMDAFDSSDWRNAIEARNQGRLAMWFDLDFPRRWIGLDPTITVAMAPPPLGASPPGPSDMLVMAFFIADTSPYPEACWTFYKYLSTNVLALADSFWPARTSVGDGPAYNAAVSEDAAAVWQAYRDALGRSSTSEQQAAWMYGVDSFGRFWLYRALDRALQGKPLDRELADAQFFTEQYLACARGGEESKTCAKQVDPSYEGYDE